MGVPNQPKTVMLNGEYIGKNHPEYSKLYFRMYRERYYASGELRKISRQYMKDWSAANTPEGLGPTQYLNRRKKARADAKKRGVDPLTVYAERGLLTRLEEQRMKRNGMG